MKQRKRKHPKRQQAETLRPLDDELKARAVRLYNRTPIIKTVADRLRVDPLELSEYLNTDRRARHERERLRDTALGRMQDQTLAAMEAAGKLKLDLITKAAEHNTKAGGVYDIDETKLALVAAKQVQDLATWTTEQQNTGYREQQILEHYERQQATPIAAPMVDTDTIDEG